MPLTIPNWAIYPEGNLAARADACRMVPNTGALLDANMRSHCDSVGAGGTPSAA